MEYFDRGAVYVDHSIDSIAKGIMEVIKRKEELSEQIIELRKDRAEEWQTKKSELAATLREYC
jgi:hypothetical protein